MQRRSSDSEGEEVCFDSPRAFNESPADSSTDFLAGRAKSFWTRYRPALHQFRPIRLQKSSEFAGVDQAGCLSFITYGWIFSYLWSAFRGRIPHDQRWNCSIYDSASVNLARLEYLWAEELKNQPLGVKPSLLRTLYRFVKTRIIISCVAMLLCLTFGFIGPTIIIRSLVDYTTFSTSCSLYGMALVLAMLVSETFRVLAYGACWAVSYRTGVRARCAVLGLLFKKVLRQRVCTDCSAGEVINIFANDGQRIFDAVTFLPLVITGPLVLIGGIVYLLHLLGPLSLLGILVFVICDILQVFIGKTIVKYRKLAIAATEQRVKLTNEAFQNIRTVKLNAWEQIFLNRFHELRNREKEFLMQTGWAQSLAIGVGSVAPVIATAITFLAYIQSGNDLKPDEAFSTITVFFVMVFGIRMIPYGARYCAEAYVSIKKIQAIVLIPEYYRSKTPPKDTSCAIVVNKATFEWNPAEKAKKVEKTEKGTACNAEASQKLLKGFALRYIDFIANKKALIGVCGPIGCGKSSLILAIIGEMNQEAGTLEIDGSLAYCAQDAWILNNTLRENVLFGQMLDEKRYFQVLYSCALNVDINQMPAGDMTEIGERGATLSGGQKARVALARALYARKDIYLLDDIFSAIDREVAQHVFHHAVLETLADKTVIIVTNDEKFLSACDKVVFVKDGMIYDQGTHKEMLSRCDDYTVFCATSPVQAPDSDTTENDSFDALLPDVDQAEPLAAADDGRTIETKEKAYLEKLLPTEDGRLIASEEDLMLESLSCSVYKAYFVAMGGFPYSLLVVLTFAAYVVSNTFSTVWLSFWLRKSHPDYITSPFRDDVVNASLNKSVFTAEEANYFASIYGSSVLFIVVTTLVKAYIFIKVTLNASTWLHDHMSYSIMHSSMKWMDSTPIGRIINRFSKDLDDVDTKIPFSFEAFFQNCLTIVAYFIVISWVFPWFLVSSLPLLVVFGLLVACFRSGMRNLKRAENNSRSPLFSFIGSVIAGKTTLHAFDVMNRSMDRLKVLLDDNNGWMFMFQSAMRWLAVWLDLLVVAISVIVSLFMVIFSGTIEPAYAGLALTFAIQMSGIFQFAVRMHAELETRMISVERINHYITNVEQDPEWTSSVQKPPKDWPASASINFQNVGLNYRNNKIAALKDISLFIQSNDKIGVVGRTGSGKSSLAAALFRLYPLTSGHIYVDGCDIGQIGLHDLRKKMVIVPQDPVLFSATLRFNLDPSGASSDEALWKVLDQTYLKPLVLTWSTGLDTMLSGNGVNLSAGQRQLLCMARALLRDVKIFVLDEATSSLDSEACRQVHECIEEQFQNSTVIVIAHRASTILGCDKIIFMSNGRLIETGSRDSLLQNRDSHLYRLLNFIYKKEVT